jgi:hypothetical protein
LIVHLFGDNEPAPRRWRDRRRCLLFELACCRRGWHLIEHDTVRPLFDAVEAAVESGAGWKGVELLRERVLNSVADTVSGVPCFQFEEELAGELGRRPARPPLHFMRSFVLSISNDRLVSFVSHSLRAAVAVGGERFDDELAAQADIVRDIFGDPFRPVGFKPEWLTGTVTALARVMYSTRDFSAMPILADALQDAGCDDEEILGHCRAEQAMHVRGCWVVDHLLGTINPPEPPRKDKQSEAVWERDWKHFERQRRGRPGR